MGARVDILVAEMRANPVDVRFEDAVRVATHYFGKPRRRSGSHIVWKMPWPLDPRVNLQPGDDGRAKAYQVRQLLDAIDRLSQQPSAARRERAEADVRSPKPPTKSAPAASKPAGKKRKR